MAHAPFFYGLTAWAAFAQSAGVGLGVQPRAIGSPHSEVSLRQGGVNGQVTGAFEVFHRGARSNQVNLGDLMTAWSEVI